MNRIGSLAACVALFAAVTAQAAPDTFGLGTGQSGALTIPNGTQVVNTYAQVTGPLAPGDTVIPVASSAGFAANDLVMVLQSTGLVPPSVSGAQPVGGIDLTADPVARWELARVQSVAAGQVTLTAALVNSYAASVTQLIRVPEYTNVTVNAGATLAAQAWNGATGGIVAFLANGTVTVNGSITASGRGFRGGVFINGSANTGCTGLDEPAPDGARKGEGIDNTAFTSFATGRGNLSNAAGGGICHNSGGGGGGNGGPGGIGGFSWSGDGSRNVGGMGGWNLKYSLLDHVTFGGGGGAGHGNNNVGTSGAAGGGAIFFRANVLAGAGSITANGSNAATTSGGGNDAAGGGGAGGSIYVRIAGAAACGSMTANGGNGGSVAFAQHGPGGGGGGGRILFQASAKVCATTVNSGVGGTESGGTQYGSGPATPTSPTNVGTQEVPPGGFTIPATPVVNTPANGAIVATTTPAFSGTAGANVTVIIFVDGVELGRVTSSATGAWSFTPAAGLSQGVHTVRAQAEFQAVRSGLSAANTFTIDSLAPAAPIINVPASGAVITTTTPTISGSAEAGSTLVLKVDGTTVTTITVPASSTWSYTLTAAQALGQGAHTATANATDAAGNTSPTASQPFTVDTVPPAVAITSPASGATVNTTTPTISGTAEIGSTVTLKVDGATVTTIVVPASGTWSYTLTAAQALGQGSHTASATASDSAGNASAPVSVPFTVDTVPPAVAFTAPASGAVVNTTQPTISGTAEVGSTVTLKVDGTTVTTIVVPASGTWSYTLTAAQALGQGAHTASATATDTAGNTSAPVTRTFTVDSVPPAVAITSPGSGAQVNSTTPTISGTAEAGSTVTVTVDGTVVATITVPASGTWTYTLSAAQAIGQGSHTVAATATDAAGNTSAPVSVSFTVDTVPPTATITAPANNTTLNSSTPTISGTAEAGSTVVVKVDGATVGTVTATSSGTFSYTLSSAQALVDGTHTASATATDAAGNTGPASSVTFSIDTAPPSAPVIAAPANNGAIGSSTPTVSGTAEPGATITITVDGTVVGTVTADSSGNWSYTLTSAQALADGAHTVSATATDGAGNVGPASSNAFTVDTVPPVAPVITAPANGSSVATATPTLSGTAEAGASVEVFIDGSSVGIVTADSSGAWTLTPMVALTEAPHTATATARDAAQNATSSSPVVFVVDLTAPSAPVVTAPADQATIGDATPTVTGTADAGASVDVFIDGSLVGTVNADSSGNWTFSPTSSLAEGNHTVSATARDAANNATPGAANAFVVDLTPPSVPSVTSPANGTAVGSSTPTVSGTGEPGSTVNVYVDGVLVGTATVDSNGNWSFPLPMQTDGSHTIAVEAFDPAGNVSTQTTVTVIIDTVAPNAPVISAPADMSMETTSTPTVSGTAEPNATVQVVVDGVVVGTVTADANGNWSYTLTGGQALGEGSHTVTATATDGAGNTGPASGGTTFTVTLTTGDGGTGDGGITDGGSGDGGVTDGGIGDGGTTDGGAGDGGVTDGGIGDGGVTDGGAGDGGVTDGGIGDGGVTDGGIGDGGMSDGGVTDGGAGDGGSNDGGVSDGGGSTDDGGSAIDGGAGGDGGSGYGDGGSDLDDLTFRGGGCGCAAGSSADPALLLFGGLALGAFVQRRRRS